MEPSRTNLPIPTAVAAAHWAFVVRVATLLSLAATAIGVTLIGLVGLDGRLVVAALACLGWVVGCHLPVPDAIGAHATWRDDLDDVDGDDAIDGTFGHEGLGGLGGLLG